MAKTAKKEAFDKKVAAKAMKLMKEGCGWRLSRGILCYAEAAQRSSP